MSLNTRIKKLLQELDQKLSIGSGVYKKAYPLKTNPNYIVKQISDSSYKNMLEYEFNFYKSYPDLFAKIVKINIDKGYMVQEKLDRVKFYNEVDNLKVVDQRFYSYFDSPANKFSGIEQFTFENNSKKIYEIFENNEFLTNLVEFLHKLSNIDISEIKNSQNGYNFYDLHLGNIGFDKNNNIKLLDI